jgi:hypothetical protein
MINQYLRGHSRKIKIRKNKLKEEERIMVISLKYHQHQVPTNHARKRVMNKGNLTKVANWSLHLKMMPSKKKKFTFQVQMKSPVNLDQVASNANPTSMVSSMMTRSQMSSCNKSI